MGTVQRSQREVECRSNDMEQRARTIIEKHSLFTGRSRLFEFQYREEVLVIRGRVPTFYLKQVLQSVLKNLDGIRRVDNQVTVDWGDGLIDPNRI
jgi:hypothetical protein